MNEPLIRMRGAAFRYGDRAVFDSLDLDVFAGEVLTILGPNGCGKSTLLRCLSGELAVDTGTVRLNGVDMRSLEANARARRIGFLFQQHVPSFPFPVLDIVGMGRAPHLGLFGSPTANDKKLAEQALDRVGMLHSKHRPYTELSGGERQLVLLARTLVQEPDIILLDEPTSHLDLRNQMASLETIGALAAQGVTMVMTTHDPQHAFLFAGRAALMKGGRFVALGDAQQVVTEASLAATYGIGIELHSVPRRDGAGRLTLCATPLPALPARP